MGFRPSCGGQAAFSLAQRAVAVQVRGVNRRKNTMRMKYLTTILATLCVAFMALGTGCKPKHEPEAGLLRQAFAGTTGEVRTHVDAALAALKAKNFEQAVDALAQLEEVELTDAQRDAVADVLVDIQSNLERQQASPDLIERTQNLMMSFM